LIITEQVNNNLYLSSRDVPMVSVIDASHMDPMNLIKHNDILMSREALVKIEEMLK
jgi:large subunit ribosomal protein L4